MARSAKPPPPSCMSVCAARCTPQSRICLHLYHDSGTREDITNLRPLPLGGCMQASSSFSTFPSNRAGLFRPLSHAQRSSGCRALLLPAPPRCYGADIIDHHPGCSESLIMLVSCWGNSNRRAALRGRTAPPLACNFMSAKLVGSLASLPVGCSCWPVISPGCGCHLRYLLYPC
ncbi:hypothetical protein M440DRAFT_141611 [Trichoderma longibrachiatum ATCC 18648]|uniref:Uncharacterized protein n=1 Tax=Trichoderma longibrachiatum ATCC 18648 TaxID=983965 RepID=A0A2T4BUW0_TRILO|nr:hypothetical protein M440DRAFT_141611 [Trichoderma longibrachiatum ATCC 18648]